MEIARPTPTQRDRAIRLLAHEARGDESAEALAAATERVCQRLSHHSGKMLGVDTFYVLLARALALVKPDFPFLGTVTVEPSQETCLKPLRDPARSVWRMQSRSPTRLVSARLCTSQA